MFATERQWLAWGRVRCCLKVTSVPRAMIFGADGQMLCENAAAVPNLSVSQLEYWERTAARQAAVAVS